MSAAPVEAAPMSVQRQRKVRMGDQFARMLADSEVVLAAHYDGLTVIQLEKLRADARAAGGQLKVVKNSVAGRVLAATPDFAPLAEQKLSGQLIYAVAPSAPALAKVMSGFAKENESLRIFAGAMQGGALAAEQIVALATLPSREQLLAQLAGTLAAPVAKLARTLQEIPSSFARAIAAVRDAGDGAS